MGGAKGGGKSCWLVMEAFAYGLEHEGATIYLFRETYDDLEANLVAEWKKRVPPELYKYHETKHIATLYNGTVIFFRYVRDRKDAEQYDGRSIDFIGVDELTKHEEASIQQLLSCLRSPKGFPPRFRATGNPGGIGHCLPYGDVLTPDRGWVDIKDLCVGDRIYAVDENQELVATTVGQTHKHMYNGDLWQAKCRGLEILCTPYHRIAKKGGVVGDRGRRYSLVPAEELPGQAYIIRTVQYHGEPIQEFTVPYNDNVQKRRLQQPQTITGNQYAELMGWFLSEGSATYTDKHKFFSVAQNKAEMRKKIKTLLDDCKFSYIENSQAYEIYSPDWSLYMKQFGKCRDKYIPRQILEANQEQLKLFFNAAMNGDGVWVSEHSGQYYTISHKLADGMSEVALKLGYAVYVSSRYRENREGKHYCVNFKSNQTTELITGQHRYSVGTRVKKPKNVTVVPFNGYVYDIGVPDYHTFVVRQNGSVWVSGNSWVKKRYINPTNKGKKTYIDDVTGNEIGFIPATVYDNEAIMQNDPAYVRRLENLPPKKRQAFLHGDWDMYDGQAFEEWDPDIHVVEPFDIPDYCYRWIGVDNGHTDPFAWYWYFVDENGFVYIYREFTRERSDPKLTYTEQAQEVLRLSTNLKTEGGMPTRVREPIGMVYAGHDAFTTHPLAPGKTIAYFYQKAGLSPIMKSIPDRKLRKAVWHEYLHPFEWQGKMVSKVRIFNTCEKLIETLPQLSEDEKDPEKVAECTFDHWYDGCLVADTVVHTTKGSYRIEDLVGREGQLYCYDLESGKATISDYYEVRPTRQNADIYEVELEDGRTIQATGDHLILTSNGWKEAHSLTESDRIVDIGSVLTDTSPNEGLFKRLSDTQVEFDGYVFTKNKQTGYYLSSNAVKNGRRMRLHRYVWEYFNGEAPGDYDIHHIDGDRENNHPYNLTIMPGARHKRLHFREASMLPEKIAKWPEIRQMGSDSHKTPEARVKQAKRSKQQWEARKQEPPRVLTCQICGSEYETYHTGDSYFCSKKCKAKDFRERFKREHGYGYHRNFPKSGGGQVASG